MIILIIIVLFAIPIAIFSTANTNSISVHFFGSTFSSVPLYIYSLLVLLIGLTIALAIHLIHLFGSGLTSRDLKNEIRDQKKKNAELLKYIHQLEVEIAELKAKYQPQKTDKKSL